MNAAEYGIFGVNLSDMSVSVINESSAVSTLIMGNVCDTVVKNPST